MILNMGLRKSLKNYGDSPVLFILESRSDEMLNPLNHCSAKDYYIFNFDEFTIWEFPLENAWQIHCVNRLLNRITSNSIQFEKRLNKVFTGKFSYKEYASLIDDAFYVYLNA